MTEGVGLQLADVVHAQVSTWEERQKFLISHTGVCTENIPVPGCVSPLCKAGTGEAPQTAFQHQHLIAAQALPAKGWKGVTRVTCSLRVGWLSFSRFWIKVGHLLTAQAALVFHDFWRVSRKPSDAGIGRYVLGLRSVCL